MPATFSTPPPESGIERLLSSLAGITSASVVRSRDGRLVEIHVLATPELHPKQIVRNVESALRAGFGIEIDRRIVSVAQAPAQQIEAVSSSVAATPPAEMHGADAPLRQARSARPYIFTGCGVQSEAAQKTICRVRLRQGNRELAGTGEGPDTPHGRAEAAARAALAALHEGGIARSVGFESAQLFCAAARRFVFVTARGLRDRQPVLLSGAAAVNRSVEEAAVLAALQATNRWGDPPEPNEH